MIYFPPIYTLGNPAVEDCGIPNRERIIIRPTEEVNLAEYGLFIGWKAEDDGVRPLPNLFLWFGEVIVAPPCWIIIYTGKGKFHKTVWDKTGELVYWFYWGSEKTLFNYQEFTPVVFKMSGILIGKNMNQLPSIGKFQNKLLQS